VIQRVVVFAGLLALGLTSVSTANAQSYYFGAPRYYADGLPPHQIMRIVRQAGFVPLSGPVRRGPNYLVVAAAPGQGPMRVAVNAYAGDVVSVRPVMAAPPYGMPGAPPYGAAPYDGPPPRYGAVPRELKDPPDDARNEPPVYGRPSAGIEPGAPPVPPRPIPNPRLANAPTTGSINTAPVPPARTPIPRPRPNVASNGGSVAPATPAARPADAPAETQSGPPAAANAPAPAKPETTMVPVAPLD